MKTKIKKFFLISITVLFGFSLKSQDIELVLLAKDDADLFINKFVSPAVEGMMYSMNNGWYHTAKTHEKFKFDISLITNAAIAPSSSKSFLFNERDYNNLTLERGNSNINTLVGDDNNSEIGVRISQANNILVAAFEVPDGYGDDLPFNAVPSAMLQASVGTPFKTDISLRLIPRINAGDGKGGLFGIGIKHNVLQYFKPLEKLPLNVSIVGGYTTMKITYDLQSSSDISGSNQETSIRLNTYTVQALVSLDFPIVTLYGGIGYDHGKSKYKVKGTYNLEYSIAGTNTTITQTETDPIDSKIDISSMRGTIGARLNLGIFRLFADFTIKEYNTLTGGMAFSF